MQIETINFTGSVQVTQNTKILHTQCYTPNNCTIVVTNDIYKPVVVNFLLYDMWYIIVFIFFIFMFWFWFYQMKKNF